ncbi:MAG: hypothetical protein PHY48_09955 [Candidatus Cloacimonetes bacterium]|nr:hypothetical protein [Candidatus Cloacimonadota bacterium]MDD2229723.1 hypothetical protein [Candidatus Cloacimonadota bacterium]
MLSFNRDTCNEYRCGLGFIPATKLKQIYSSLIFCLVGGALRFSLSHAGEHIATTSGGSSE